MTSGKAPTSRRAGLTLERIVDAAQELSRRSGIDGWSIRELADELGVVPSVIYHYYGTKDEICDAVVDRVFSRVGMPDPTLGWKQWLTAMLMGIRPVLLEYHGVADRLIVGRLTESVLPIIDLAAAKFLEAGFGDLTPMAYSVIVNSALSTIANRNRRSPKENTRRHDLHQMLDRMEPLAENSPGMRLMIDQFLGPLGDPQHADEVSEKYFTVAIEALIEGMEHILNTRGRQKDQGHVPPRSEQ